MNPSIGHPLYDSKHLQGSIDLHHHSPIIIFSILKLTSSYFASMIRTMDAHEDQDLNRLPNVPSSRYRNSDVHDANNEDGNPANWIGKDFDDQIQCFRKLWEGYHRIQNLR
ncbi:unnamed protein product [Lactuca saligna]|uniref:Uncharacterized protein n=1 Tax=Lactuca saligna TaxID=75948 RepID=A0AA35ZNF1_LACSI|nr:unnamed protein product [Lactuca saligna]